MVEFVTVGVYGWDVERFFAALQSAKVDLLVDIRRRRAVRGAEYAFANSQRLQARLSELHIRYSHRIDLSPSDLLRKRQGAADEAHHIARRLRAELDDDFRKGFVREVLDNFDSARFVADLGPDSHVVALMCVERPPEACHRGMLAERLERDLNVKVTHLTP